MIRELTIENFRGFRSFEMRDLGRVNLIVGSNSSGKTSVLEALHVLTAPGSLQAFCWIGSQRGELNEAPNGGGIPVEFSHLFYGHQVVDTTSVNLTYHGDNGDLTFTATPMSHPGTPIERELKLSWNGSVQQGPVFTLPISTTGVGKIGTDAQTWGERLFGNRSMFVTSASLTARDAVDFFDAIVLSKEEELLIEALRAINPQIQRVAPKHDYPFDHIRRGGFHVLLEGQRISVPIGDLGDGVWRMLSLALALAMSANGVLLIDEIDTGLHFTVMDQMWQLVSAAAEKLNVQVFATTHSRDCVESLACICRREPTTENRVSMHRIEPDKPKAIPFSEREIIAVAERAIEIR